MTPETSLKTTGVKTAPWVKVALVASLALNLAVAGVVAGAVLNHRRDGGPEMRPQTDAVYGAYAHALGRKDRRAIFEAMRTRPGDFRAVQAARAQGFARVIDALRAEPFDMSVLKSVLDEQLAQATARQSLGQELLLERIEAMSADDRAEFATRLQDVLAHGLRDRKRVGSGS